MKNVVKKRRWLKALEIAKVLFEDEGYHTEYLEEIESHIRKEDKDEDDLRGETKVAGKIV